MGPSPAFSVFLVIIVAVVFVLLLIRTASMNKRYTSGSDPRLCRGCGASHPGFASFCRRCGRKL